MTSPSNTWNEKAFDIFAEATVISDARSRKQFIEANCETSELLHQVESLLKDHEQSAGFLETPAINAVRTSRGPIDSLVGSKIGPYKLLEVIGEGGFGTVYMAEQKVPIHRRVALKIINPGMDSRHIVARFEAERQALAMMDHPNIANVIDAGTTDRERPYFVMELVKGVPITQFCDDNLLPIRERLKIFIDVCLAVQHAHQKGVIHRDLKPSNVMVTLRDGKPFVKIIDFGIAKAMHRPLTEKTLFTSFGQLVGTPHYMSPEQASNCSDVDTRSDVYSLGVLLFELSTGSPPLCPSRLSKSGYDELRRLIINEALPKPSRFLRDDAVDLSTISSHRSSDASKLPSLLSGDIDLIVMHALDKDREQRYSTAESFANDIQRFLDGVPIEARPPSTVYRVSKFLKRNRVSVVIVTAIAAALLVGMIAITWALIRVRSEAAVTKETMSKLESANQKLETTNSHLREKFLHEAIASAMSPNRERTVNSLSIAQQAGASESRCEMVRGILKRTEGEPDAAVLHLQRSVDLDPSNLAAKCQLLGVSFDQGDFREFNRLKLEINKSKPSSAEDYVFKGGVLKIMSLLPDALALIERGKELHSNPIFDVFHAGVLGDVGFESRDIEVLNTAVKVLADAQSLYGSDHNGIRTTLLQTIRQCILVARLDGCADRFQHLITMGDAYVQALSQSKVAKRHFVRALYLVDVKHDIPAAKRAWQDVIKYSTGDLWITFYSAFLLEHEGYEQAVSQFRIPNRSYSSQAWETLLLALGSGERRARAANTWEHIGNMSSHNRHLVLQTAFLLNDEDGILRASKNWTETTWLGSRFELASGELSEESFIDQNDNSGPFLVAMRRLNEGERDEAIRLLESCDELGSFTLYDQLWRRGILAEMKRRPNWPTPYRAKQAVATKSTP